MVEALILEDEEEAFNAMFAKAIKEKWNSCHLYNEYEVLVLK